MTKSPRGYASANLTHYLASVHFPASKRDLLQRARDGGAGQDALEMLESLPEDAKFDRLTDILAAAGPDQAPQTGIIDRKP
ncbi:MAG TPA: DUF2795 domain-containing protein [Roseiarcus sp.]|jgi:hypothetical protein|nr:DUF2795 domain-containing protein [Roseiarcus sp.]